MITVQAFTEEKDVYILFGLVRVIERASFSKMSCDGDLDHLHEFAETLGIEKDCYAPFNRGYPCYIISSGDAVIAIENGAVRNTEEEQIFIWNNRFNERNGGVYEK